ncbi:hypothetical protein [Cellulomonas sp. URHE0023]|uniref:hypothetical protein n=1 Tax=Cellulomonas sp. URHE0023 TaxID=1380354 RepID=UPI000480D22A|nr:hypothetical protein [Cellulomonas sp. URHE0023]
MSVPVDDGAERNGPGGSPTGVADDRGRRRGRRRVGVAVGVVVVVVASVVLAIVLLGGDDSQPAPPMTDEARAAGAVRLTYPNRALPPPIAYFPFEGQDRVQVEFDDVESGADGLLASFAVRTEGDDVWHPVELPSGGQTDVDGVRVRVVAVHDGELPKDDAADVVLEPLP